MPNNSFTLISDENNNIYLAKVKDIQMQNTDIDNNQEIDAHSSYVFVAEKGFRKMEDSNFYGRDIINIKNRNLEEVPKKYLKEITTKAISSCLDGRDLASRKIFKKINK